MRGGFVFRLPLQRYGRQSVKGRWSSLERLRTVPKNVTANWITFCFTSAVSIPVAGTLVGVTLNPVTDATRGRMSVGTVNVSKLQKSVGTPEIGADVKRPVAVCKSRIALEFACPIAPEFCICAHNPESKWRCSTF